VTFTDPNEPPEITRHPYNLATPQRGGDTVIGFLALLRNDGVRCFIAGGFARWVLSVDHTTPCPGDIDIFFENEEHFQKAKFILDKEGFRTSLETSNALTLTPPNTAEFDVGSMNIQLIRPCKGRCGTVYDVLDGFDINVCQAALVLTSKNTLKGYVSNVFVSGETHQRIRIAKMGHPLAVMQRCIKYASKGYKVSTRVLLQIFVAWDKLPQEERQQAYDLMKNGQFSHLYNLLGRETTPSTDTFIP